MNQEKQIMVIPLGTISPYCKDDHNCPGFLIQYGNNKILLDCGNGITRNMNLPEDLNNLNIIISHLHYDHYSSLSSIADAYYVYKKLGYINEPIKVYVPCGDKIEVNEYYTDSDGWGASRKVEKNIIDYDYIENICKEKGLTFIPYSNKDKLSFDDISVIFNQNPHQLITYSMKLECDNIKLVYSGDTGYKGNNLERLSKDADLLICESTFLKGQYKSEDYHLYAYEAASIAKSANVKKLLLTHFWPEIDRQLYVDEARKIFNNVEAAEEGKKLILKRSRI